VDLTHRVPHPLSFQDAAWINLGTRCGYGQSDPTEREEKTCFAPEFHFRLSLCFFIIHSPLLNLYECVFAIHMALLLDVGWIPVYRCISFYFRFPCIQTFLCSLNDFKLSLGLCAPSRMKSKYTSASPSNLIETGNLITICLCFA
jgi:hypothetical protein